MGNKNIFKICRTAAGLRIKINTAGYQSAGFENNQHGFGKFVKVYRKFICIPTILVVAPISIYTSQHSRVSRHLKIVLERMTGKCGMIYFDIKLEILVESIVTQETNDSGCIKVV